MTSPPRDVTTLPVGGSAGSEPYEVLVGQRLYGELPALVGDRAVRVGLIHPAALAPLADRIADVLTAPDRTVVPVRVPDAEEAKTAGVAAACWETLGRHGFTRTDVVVGVGGGATTDLAGFVAAS
ncbi:3-dehydroquinate synthase, partial [Streptomyces sp. NPDC053755]